jgi:hypothetical protein
MWSMISVKLVHNRSDTVSDSLDEQARKAIRMALRERKMTQIDLAHALGHKSRHRIVRLLAEYNPRRFDRELAEEIRAYFGYQPPWPYPTSMTAESRARYHQVATVVPNLRGGEPVRLAEPLYVPEQTKALLIDDFDLAPAVRPGDVLLTVSYMKVQLDCLNVLRDGPSGPILVRYVSYSGLQWQAAHPVRSDDVFDPSRFTALGVVVGHVGTRRGTVFCRYNPQGLTDFGDHQP